MACAPTRPGDVRITEGEPHAVVEYAHGGKTPLATIKRGKGYTYSIVDGSPVSTLQFELGNPYAAVVSQATKK
jgi:hypothetical protein